MEPHNPIGTASSSGTTVFTGNTKITTFKELVFFVNVRTLGRAFVSECSNLTEIHIPASVTTLGNYAFNNTQNLRKVYFYPSNPPTTGTAVFGNTTGQSMGYNTRNTGTNEFHVPVGATGYGTGSYTRLTNTTYSGFRLIYDL